MSETSAVPPVPSVADGIERKLDPRYVPFQRLAGAISTTVMSGGSLIGVIVLFLATPWPPWADFLLLLAWLAFVAGLVWLSYSWPVVEHRYTSYKLDEDGIEIRSGVVWREVKNVPRSRVQHIDVSQGPLERYYGLGRLIIYTAGTDHSRVELPGLSHAVAFELRNHLLPRGSDDAI